MKRWQRSYFGLAGVEGSSSWVGSLRQVWAVLGWLLIELLLEFRVGEDGLDPKVQWCQAWPRLGQRARCPVLGRRRCSWKAVAVGLLSSQGDADRVGK